jgi:hypothetical protein
MIDTTGLDADQVNVLEYVAGMLRHGMQPRIVNVTPETVQMRQQADYPDDEPLTEADLWEVAKQADQEVENDHRFLEGTDESIADAVASVLDLRVE